MSIFVVRLIRAARRSRTWSLPALVLSFVFLTSWPLMRLVEPAGARLANLGDYAWYFVVTATTVGYGDTYPVSSAGKVVGGYVILGGIATITTLFAQIGSALERAKGRRMKGSITVTAADHVVVLGYTAGRTERIVAELLADSGRAVVLAAWPEVEVHPMPDVDVAFVRGDLTNEDVLRRAGVHRAASVLIDGRDDNEALAMLVTVDHVAPSGHLVVALRDLSRSEHLRYVNHAVRCVQWHQPRMITEELQDPGITEVYEELMTSGGSNTYSIRLPDPFGPVPFGDCQTALGRRYGATLLAVHSKGSLSVSPPWTTEVAGGATLYYVGQQRIGPDQLREAIKSGWQRTG